MRPTTSSTDVPHFVENGVDDLIGGDIGGDVKGDIGGDRPSRHAPAQLSDSEYAAALDNLVLTCVDVVFVHQQSVLLVKRARLPRKSWWMIGGRMVPGESPRQAAQRKAASEAGLNLDADRLVFVGVYSTRFAYRHQPPHHHGSHTVNLTYCIRLTEVEMAQLSFNASEHDGWQWVNYCDVPGLLKVDDPFDQALLTVVKDVQHVLAICSSSVCAGNVDTMRVSPA